MLLNIYVIGYALGFMRLSIKAYTTGYSLLEVLALTPVLMVIAILWPFFLFDRSF